MCYSCQCYTDCPHSLCHLILQIIRSLLFLMLAVFPKQPSNFETYDRNTHTQVCTVGKQLLVFIILLETAQALSVMCTISPEQYWIPKVKVGNGPCKSSTPQPPPPHPPPASHQQPERKFCAGSLKKPNFCSI